MIAQGDLFQGQPWARNEDTVEDHTTPPSRRRSVQVHDALKGVIERVSFREARHRLYENRWRWQPVWLDDNTPCCLMCRDDVPPLVEWIDGNKTEQSVTKRRWCSGDCLSRACSERRRWALEDSGRAVCAFCGSIFRPESGAAKFCKSKCRQAAYRRRLSRRSAAS